MIIKVQDNNGKDKFLVEAAYIRWVDQAPAKDFIILEIHVLAAKKEAAGPVSLSTSSIEEEPSLILRIYHGDRVFIMNNEGKTIDSKRIVLTKKGRQEERNQKLEARGYDPKKFNDTISHVNQAGIGDPQ